MYYYCRHKSAGACHSTCVEVRGQLWELVFSFFYGIWELKVGIWSKCFLPAEGSQRALVFVLNHVVVIELKT